MIKEESIQKLLDQVDIVDVVSHYIPLRRSGVNFVGICPFHDDKNPSMSVSSNLGIFHCFSCKAGGNAIKFIMDYEKLSYPEAIEKLAALSNFTLEYSAKGAPVKEEKHILAKVGAYYQSLLYKTPAAIEYLYSRGFDDALIAKFELGYAPTSQNTIHLLENEKIEPNEALDVGIVKQNDRGFYASFVERITFPIKNHTGKIVGFGGRTITNHIAKYVNSPQSRVFDKSQILYAYDVAKKSAYDKKELIITEGYMDTIMLHKAGFTNAIAVLGTALTDKHLPLLRRGDTRIVLCFDGDEAGINAAIKSSRLLTINELDTSVVILPNGLDPADLVQKGDLRGLEKALENRVEAGEFLIKSIISNYEISRPQQKQKALEEVQKYTFELKPVVADAYKGVVSRALNIDINSFFLSKFKRVQNEVKKTQAPNLARKRDYLELEILKTCFMDKDSFKTGLDLCEKEIFATHFDIYEAVFSSQKSQKQVDLLRELAIDDSVNTLNNEKKLYDGIKMLKEKYYQSLLKELAKSSDADKIDKIVKIQKILRRLKGAK
ncbi:DNA primase [Campylobacter geochelonis]|uniref:DNA primase n=1 Tax=Campylobacter geochelonis TaxID=1780362 RepID=A0A128EBR8_9BACT|nr:DNA primase [Campylobacter geochelonis]QKF70377.1 DNA primase [Campylobacter geochelonis]CZE46410.1 DNA primase [Campylobacter geochelonis]